MARRLFISNSRVMKTFAIKLIIIILLIVGIDVVVGAVSDRLVMNMPETSSYISKTTYSILKKKTDILILGASKAKHGYNPFMIEDSLGADCYNAAEDGCDMMYYDMMLAGFQSRCNPKIVIIDMAPLALMNQPTIDNGKYLYGLSPIIDSFYDQNLSLVERIKQKSNLYRFNGFYGQMASNLLNKNSANKGYTPLEGTYSEATYKIDTLFTPNVREINYMNDVVTRCKRKNVRLIMCISPSYHFNPIYNKYLQQYCKHNGIEFYDMSEDKDFLHPEMFKDKDHLNKDGSKKFTEELISRIKHCPRNKPLLYKPIDTTL